MKHFILLLLVVVGGCTSGRDTQGTRAQIGQDEATFVSRYQHASASTAEVVLKDYLALADDYERRGWGQRGKPGWIERLRGLCYGRLSALAAARSADDYEVHMQKAVMHLNNSAAGGDYTADEVKGLIDALDAKISPQWRTQLSQPGASLNPAPPHRCANRWP